MKLLYSLALALVLSLSVVAADDAQTNVTVGNVLPTVDSIDITPDDDTLTVGTQVNAVPGNNKTIVVSALVSDANGQDDLNTVTLNVFGPSVVNGVPVTLTCSPIDGDTANCTGAIQLSFTNTAGTYTTNVSAVDVGGLSNFNVNTFEYVSQVAVQLDATSMVFGSLNPGQTSSITGDTNMGTMLLPTVRNLGNAAIDLDVSGTNLAGASDTLPVSSIDYRFGSDSFQTLSTSAVTNDVNLASDATTNLDLDLTVPNGVLPGDYSGLFSVNAIVG